MRIHRDHFLPYVKAHPDLLLTMLSLLCQRLRWTSSIIEDAAFLAVPARLAKRLAPKRTIRATDQFVVSDEIDKAKEGFAVSLLFRGDLRWITPLLWIAYIASSTAVLPSWLRSKRLMTAASAGPEAAAGEAKRPDRR